MKHPYWCDICDKQKVKRGSYQCTNTQKHSEIGYDTVDVCRDCYHKETSKTAVNHKQSSKTAVNHKQSNNVMSLLSSLTHLIETGDEQTINILSQLAERNEPMNSNTNSSNQLNNSIETQQISSMNSNTNTNQLIPFSLSAEAKQKLKQIKIHMFDNIDDDDEFHNPLFKVVIALTKSDYDDQLEANTANNCKKLFVNNSMDVPGEEQAVTSDVASFINQNLTGNALKLYAVIQNIFTRNKIQLIQSMTEKCSKKLQENFVKVTMMNLEQLIIDCVSVMFTLNVDCNICCGSSKLVTNRETSFSLRKLLIDQPGSAELDNNMFEDDSIGDINIIVGNTIIGYIECAQIIQIRYDAQIFTERDSFIQCLTFLKQLPAMIMKKDIETNLQFPPLWANQPETNVQLPPLWANQPVPQNDLHENSTTIFSEPLQPANPHVLTPTTTTISTEPFQPDNPHGLTPTTTTISTEPFQPDLHMNDQSTEPENPHGLNVESPTMNNQPENMNPHGLTAQNMNSLSNSNITLEQIQNELCAMDGYNKIHKIQSMYAMDDKNFKRTSCQANCFLSKSNLEIHNLRYLKHLKHTY